jgi:hypothetical protein
LSGNKAKATRLSGLTPRVMVSSSLSSVLVSLVKENASEPKNVLIPSLVSFLMDSFPFMSENQALSISLKAYENA